jgi:hypothetical protein
VVLSSPLFERTCTPNAGAWTYDCGNVPWYGPSSLTAKLRALSWDVDASGAVSAYRGFAERDVGLNSGQAQVNVNLALSAVGEATVSGSVSAPSGFAVAERQLEIVFFDPPASIPIWSSSDAVVSSSFSHRVPTISGAHLAAYASAASITGEITAGARVVPASAASGIVIELPPAPSLGEPADAATDVSPGSSLSWSPVPRATYLVLADPASGGPSLFAVTDRPSFRIPDLSELGAGLQPNTSHEWRVFAMAPCASSDSAADGDVCGAMNYFKNGRLLPARDGQSLSASRSRLFTTRP